MQKPHPIDTLLKHLFLILGILVFIAFAFFTIWGDNGLKKMWSLKQKKNALASQNLNILNQNWLYLQEVTKLKDPKFLEQRARSEMGMVRTNETVYVVDVNQTP